MTTTHSTPTTIRKLYKKVNNALLIGIFDSDNKNAQTVAKENKVKSFDSIEELIEEVIEEPEPEVEISETHRIIKEASTRVYEQLGFGLSENAYQTALAAELVDLDFHNVQTEFHVSQYYTTSKGRKVQVADLRIDILIGDSIILELKTVDGVLEKLDKKTGKVKMDEISKLKEFKQCERYKALKTINEGYLINFGKELSRPIVPREAHLEYLSTQYLCEFIKQCF